MSALPGGSLTLKPEYCDRFRKEAKREFGNGRYLTGLQEAVNQTLEPQDQISIYTITRALNGTGIRGYNMQPICQHFGVSWQEGCIEGHVNLNGHNGFKVATKELEGLVNQILGKVQFEFSSRTLAGGAQTSSSWVQDNFVELDFYEVDHLPADYPVLDPTRLKYQENNDDDDEFVRQRIRFPRAKRITLRQLLQKHRSVFIYGDPGSGKTSCLEWIALKCQARELFEGCVPIFLGSRRFATANKSETLLSLFEKMFIQWGFLPTDLNTLLEAGRVVFIFDGLDETPVAERERMEIMINELIRDHPKCHFFCSSRLGLEYSFSSNFPKVFVAPFKRSQIEDFVTCWFSQLSKDPGLGTLMIQKLKSTTYSGIKELSTRPVLLELLCFVFEGIQDFPPKRFEIFRNGIQRMTRKNIQIETDIPELSVLREQHIYTILCLVASYFFINLKGQIIFPTLAVEGIIRKYFKEKLNIDGISVPDRKILQAIEQSNGLLTRWAHDFCSFSHLTYQEFFTAEYLVKTSRYDEVYEHINNPRWHYVIGLVAECIPYEKTLPFFTGFKERIDQEISEDRDIRLFLRVLEGVTQATAAGIKSNRPNMTTYIRAWYFVYALQDPGQVTNVGSVKRYFELPDFDFATSTVSNKRLECHGLVYKVYHRMNKGTMGPESFLNSLEQLVRLLTGDIKNTEVVEGWLHLIGREQLKYQDADAWWSTNYENWQKRIVTFVETLKMPSTMRLTLSHRKKLRAYYEATKLLSICMNRSSLNDLQRQAMSDSMLTIITRDTE
ncbi:MAG: NACHT domain-containing protein [Cyanobacteria bacterium P01_D01_bin.156]